MTGMADDELKVIVPEHMDKGFLENIIDMFKHYDNLYPLIVDMIKDERMRVRLGVTALVEELVKETPPPAQLIKIIPDIGKLLKDPDSTVRGDAANILGIIKHKDALPYLLDAENDADVDVKEVVRDAISEIRASGAQ